VAEIRAAFQIMKPGMKNSHGLAVQGSELVAQQALVLPDGLQEALWWGIHILAQDQSDATLNAPAGVKAVLNGGHGGHLVIAFAPSVRQCQASTTVLLKATCWEINWLDEVNKFTVFHDARF
jgi:hypothetical protein